MVVATNMRALAVSGMLVLLAAPAAASPVGATRSVDGQIVGAHARWTADGSRIVTEATVRTATGDVVVSQLGGTVDGLTMRTFPGPEPLVTGMQVALAVHDGLDLARRTHVVVDGVRVLARPPGFVRTGPTQAGHFLFWESGCVFVTPDAAGTREVPGDLEFDAIDQAIAAWNEGGAACSYMDLVEAPREAREVGRDNVNLIKFRDASWCRPAVDDDPARCYPPSAAGLTTAVFVDDAGSARDGAIVDADIELNGEQFAIAHEGQSAGTAECQAEITNTLTHELGHLLGFEHTCLAGGDPERVDGDGNPVPLCAVTTDPAILDATMYNFQECGETKKASLSPDDVAAICSVYPLANDPGVCAPVTDEGGCCGTSGDAPPLLLGGVVLAWLARRRRPRPARAA